MDSQIALFSDKTFKNLIENSGMFILVLSTDETISLINKKGCEVLGRPAKDIIGKNWFENFIPDPDRSGLRNAHGRFSSGGMNAEMEIEYLVRTADGPGRTFEWKIALLKAETGEIIATLHSGVDVTERKRAQAALQDNQATLSQIIEGSPIPTFVIDESHQITHWNRACENLTGIPAVTAVGTDNQWCAFYSERRPVLADLVLHDADHQEISRYYPDKYQKSRVKTGAFEVEDFFPTLGQTGRWLYVTAAPLVDSEGRIFGAIETLQDITERKNAEKDLHRRKEELNHKSRHLAKANQALKAMLDHREIEKKAIEENMLLNLKKFVLPYLEEMSRCKMTQDAEVNLNIIKANLGSLMASMSNSLFAKYQDLTPKEILVADFIRQGKSTKEIAEAIHISPGSVSFHRNNIRKKMGLLKKKSNLRVYLASLA